MEENPFPQAKIADWSFLDASSPRRQCPICGKSRKYYCYTCLVPLPHIAPKLPYVKLPVRIDIIKHPSEMDGKSTSPHAAILAPDDVIIHTYPCIPDYDVDKVILVFPCEDSVTLEQLAARYILTPLANDKKINHGINVDTKSEYSESNKDTLQRDETYLERCDNEQTEGTDSQKCQEDDSNGEHQIAGRDSLQLRLENRSGKRALSVSELDEVSASAPSKKAKTVSHVPFNRIVFIDSTWNQTRNIVQDERIKNLKTVELKSRNTHFWRSQEGIPRTYLSTIEAIYYFMKDLHTFFINPIYNNEYDNLLFFFSYMYNKIRTTSQGGKELKAYQK